MLINNRFKTETTPDQEAFGRLSEQGMLLAMLEIQGIDSDATDDWPKDLPEENLNNIYEDYLSAVSWLEYIINPASPGSALPRSKYLGEWMQHLEWGLLPYAIHLDLKFKFLHARLVKAMGITGTPSIKGGTANQVIR